MGMTYDEYQNKRSWLIDTAETPKDKKNLKSDLAKLDAQYKSQAKAVKSPKPVPKKSLTVKSSATKPMSKIPNSSAKKTTTTSRQAAAMDKLMKERSAISKKTGMWPTDKELNAYRKKKK